MSDLLFVDIETLPVQPDDVAYNLFDEKGVDKTSFDGTYGHICCAGWAVNDSPSMCSIMCADITEREVLEVFFEAVNECDHPILIGHNILGFDLKFLFHRAVILGVKMPRNIDWDAKPWSQRVYDTMLRWNPAHDKKVKLDRLCLVMGLEGKQGMDGSMVRGLFEQGKYQEIATYCKNDVDALRSVYYRMVQR